jgi:4-carboxymuconolactone decarboxylase
MKSNEESGTPLSRTTEMTYAILPDRMPPIPFEEMTDAQRRAAAEVIAGPRGEVRGPYWPLLRSPGFMMSVQRVGLYTRYQCPLDRRINEMATLMGVREWMQQYVWNAHYGKAIKAGLKPSIAEAIAEGRRPAGMAEDEEILYDFLTEVFANKSVSDPTFEKVVAKFGESGLIDILGIVGYYMMAGMIMNVTRTALTDGRPLPLVPTPAPLRSLMSGTVSADNYTLIPSQQKEFDGL